MTDEQASAIYGGDFDAIQAAVLETPRGRWFLGEFARRNRVAETGVLLDAIGRLERGVSGPTEREEQAPVAAALDGMREAIGRAKTAVAELGPGPDKLATADALARVALTAETATADILRATQRIGEIARALRGAGAAANLCDEMDRRTTQVYTACAFHDLTAERTRTVLEAFRIIDAQLAALDAPAGPERTREAADPQPSSISLPQSPSHPAAEEPASVDATESAPPCRRQDHEPSGSSLSPAEVAPEPPPLASAGATGRPVSLEKLLALDRLDIRERLRLFT